MNKILSLFTNYKFYCQITFVKNDKIKGLFIDNHYYQSLTRFPLNDWRLKTEGIYVSQKIVLKNLNYESK